MPFQGQWADSLLAFERVHALRLAIWALTSLLVGSALLTWVRVRHLDSPLLRHFAIQCAAWGALLLSRALGLHQGLALRDLAGAVALDRRIWFGLGLDLGCVAVGAVLAVTGSRLGRHLALVGAGLAIIVQGLALGVLDLQLASAVIR